MKYDLMTFQFCNNGQGGGGWVAKQSRALLPRAGVPHYHSFFIGQNDQGFVCETQKEKKRNRINSSGLEPQPARCEAVTPPLSCTDLVKKMICRVVLFTAFYIALNSTNLKYF